MRTLLPSGFCIGVFNTYFCLVGEVCKEVDTREAFEFVDAHGVVEGVEIGVGIAGLMLEQEAYSIVYATTNLQQGYEVVLGDSYFIIFRRCEIGRP